MKCKDYPDLYPPCPPTPNNHCIGYPDVFPPCPPTPNKPCPD